MNYTMPKHIGDYNKNQMLSILRERGPTSRVELSRLLGISPAAISRSTSRLLDKGIIKECDAGVSDMGRKPVPVELCRDFCYVLGADLVGGTLKIALADLMGEIIKYHEEPIFREKGAHAVLGQLLNALKKIIRDAGAPQEKIWVITIGTPGIFNPETGKSKHTFFIDKWDDIDIRSWVFESLSIETVIENDVNLDVIGESWKGVGQDYDNILYVKLGQGLAARVVLEGRLLRGEHHMAGEIGYMLPASEVTDQPVFAAQDAVVNYEHMLNNTAASRQYRDITGEQSAATISDICGLANGGDEPAKTVLSQLLDHFGVVLLNSATVLDPQVIILGGDAGSFGEKEIAVLKKRIEEHFPLPNIIPSKLQKQACLYGAIKMGLDRVEKRITDIW